MALLPPFRDAVISIERNGIGKISMMGLGQPDVIPLWFGETDLPTPAFICDAAKRALDQGRTFYTFSRGIPELRQEIQRWTSRWYGARLADDRISAPGSSMMCVNIALQLTVGAGDNCVIVAPIWPNIFNAVRGMEAEPRLVRLDAPQDGAGWRLDLDRLFAACDARTKAMFICSPGNPTGWIISAQEQAKILEFARRRGIAIISDEVYGPLTYGRPHASFASLATDRDAVFIVNGFSKAWAMTGWRAGWLVHPTQVAPWVAELANIDNTGIATFAQWGAVTALSDGDGFVKDMNARCAAGRTIVDAAVKVHPRLTWAKPDGAFYGFIHVDGVKNSLDFAEKLLRDYRVGVAPGSAFGIGDPANESFIRICFAQDPSRLSDAMDRIGQATS